MRKVYEINNFFDMQSFYIKFFDVMLKNRKQVLYVGYEEEDFLLPILAKNHVSIIAVDREKRKNIFYDNVKYIHMDFLDCSSEISYDVVILSFVLHENQSYMHVRMIELATKISKEVILIEPLPRQNLYGISYEKMVSEKFAMQNMIKYYYSEEYWGRLVNFDESKDKKIILDRSRLNSLLLKKDKENSLYKIGMQNIIIIVSDNGKKK